MRPMSLERTGGEENPQVETAEIYRNAFFEVQVRRRDRHLMPGFGLSGAAFDDSPFPAELSDEDILEWHDRVDHAFREGLGRRTIERLGDNPEGA